MTFSRIVILLSDMPVLATVISAAWLYHQFSKPLKACSLFIFLSGIIQFASLLFWFIGKNNMPLLHLYVAAGFLLIVRFYKTVLGDLVDARIFWGTGIAFLVFTLANSLFVQHIFRFNSNALTVESILIIIITLFTFIFLLNDTIKEINIPDRQSLTWINSGLFIYHLSCLLIFHFGDTIIFRFSLELSRFTWAFHAFFSIVMYTCFFIGLWKRSKIQNLSMPL